MRQFRKLFILVIFFSFIINSNALNENNDLIEINPDWVMYNSLSDEEKALYEVIPEEYIYKYIPKKNSVLNHYSKNYFSLDADDEIPTYFNLSNIENKRYINSKIKDQGSLGLCWAFASIGSLESNILYKGVKGLDDAIKKCDESNTSSVYCDYKKDNEINNYYISNAIECETNGCLNQDGVLSKKIINNATFSERIIDYIRSKPSDISAYNDSSNNYTLINEKFNPYTSNSRIGSGGSFSDVAKMFSYGVTPTRTIEGSIWEKYTQKHSTVSLYDVFDSVNSIYQVTNYYNFPTTPSNIDEKESWMKELKEMIMRYGSVYVSTLAPQESSAGSCYYDDSKNNVYLINRTGTCGKSGLHAMQIIGWDDDYEFEYCKLTETTTYTNGSSPYTRYYSSSLESQNDPRKDCETEKITEGSTYTKSRIGTWTSGKGAWILKNSWGSTKVYPYLSYNTSFSGSGVREVSVKNYDNSYNEKSTFIKSQQKTDKLNGVTTPAYIYEFKKNNKKEYLTLVNFQISTYDKNYEVYISNDGINYEFVSQGSIDYPGLYSVNINNYEVSRDKFYVKVIGESINKVNAFTINECTFNNNCNGESSIFSRTEKDSFSSIDTKFEILTNSINIKSGSKIDYKIFNENNEDITNNFEMGDNYIVENSHKATLKTSVSLDVGTYYLHTISNDVESVSEFEVIDRTQLKVEAPELLLLDTKDAKMSYKISSTLGTSNYKWTSSNQNVLKVDDDGNLTLLKTGSATVTLTIDTVYGKVSDSVKVYISNPIYTTEEFLKMLSIEDNANVYYLMNDLDFKDIDLSRYKWAYTFRGVFNGGNNTIKNMNKTNITTVDEIGLFNRLYYATVKNIKILDSEFSGVSSGSVAGYALYSTIENIYTNSSVSSTYSSGGIVGQTLNTTISEVFNIGRVSAISDADYTYSGGIIGNSSSSNIYNSYNEGYVYSESKWNKVNNGISESYAGGIIAKNLSSYINNSYNVGKVIATSDIERNLSYSNGLHVEDKSDTIQNNINNSYYLKDKSYTISFNEYEKDLNELQQQNNFIDWDFENIWRINEDLTTPSLKRFDVEAEKVDLNLFSTTLNTDELYDFTYKIYPFSSSGNINIMNKNKDIFEITNSQIITKNEGTDNIVFNVGEKVFEIPITVKELFTYKYNDNLTNQDINVNISVNYFKRELDANSYLKLIYKIDELEYEKNFNKDSAINEYSFSVSNNSKISLNLYICNSVCDLIENKEFNITKIDKEKPIVNYVVDNLNDTLQINIKDAGISGLPNNVYEYAISNSDKIAPTKFNIFKPNTLIKDVRVDRVNKYLWIKNFSDNVGNKVTEEEYIVYKIDLDTVYYTISYYDENNVLKKSEKIKENDIVILNYVLENYEDDNYYYIFDNWNGYVEGMKATEDIKLYAIYKKEAKEINSNLYKIENGYIHIKLNDVNNEYSQKLFISNLEEHKNYNFYDVNNALVTNKDYIETGMRYKNNIKQYILVLSGDVTGDGRVKMNDIMKIANHLIKKNVLNNEYLIAGDVTGDSDVKMNDVMKIASTLVKGGSL